MKKKGFAVTVLLLLLTFGIPAQANLLTNGGFEDGDTGQITGTPIPGWSTWGWNGWHHDDAGAVIDTKAVKLWWSDSGIYQDFAAVPGETYTFSGYMLHTSADPLRDGSEGPGTGNKTGDFQFEWYDASNTMIADGFFGQITKDDPTDTWLYYSADLTAPAGTAYGRYLIRMYADMGDGAVNYDNASVVPEPATLALLGLSGLFLRRRRG